MVSLILSKYVITNQIAQTTDVCEVMYVTLNINSDLYSNCLRWFVTDVAKIILMRKCTAPNTVKLVTGLLHNVY